MLKVEVWKTCLNKDIVKDIDITGFFFFHSFFQFEIIAHFKGLSLVSSSSCPDGIQGNRH